MSAEKPRQIAARVLLRWSRTGRFIDALLEEELQRHPLRHPDRGLVHELTHGVVRWQATLDALIARKTAGRAQRLPLLICLRLGLYQMFWLDRVPDHAVVHETVDLAKSLSCSGQAGFVNAVLRGYLREREATEQWLAELKRTEPALGYSHPEWLYQRWAARWPAEAVQRLMEWNNTPPPTYARVNTLRTTPQALAERWEREGVGFEPRQWDWTEPGEIFELTSHPPLHELDSFQDGWFYVQDPSTLLAVKALQAGRGHRVLDLCAAPGGKTTYLAQLMQNQGHILARELQRERREMLWQNCQRLGVQCVRLAEAKEAGAITPSPTQSAASPAEMFDRALVDAPCSNTGVMRRRVELRWRIRPEEIKRLQESQLDLLEQAYAEVAPGGRVVYSTCSLEPEENELVIEAFTQRHPEAVVEFQRLLRPFEEGVDGAFVARLRKGPKRAG